MPNKTCFKKNYRKKSSVVNWNRYESEKAYIFHTSKSHEEYDARIKQLVEKLGI